MPGDRVCGGVEAGGAHGLTIRILKEEGADFAGVAHHGAELAESFAIRIKKPAAKQAIAVVLTFGEGFAVRIVKEKRAGELVILELA